MPHSLRPVLPLLLCAPRYAPLHDSAADSASPALAALGSQIKSVYRHGTPRDCMPKFEDFKFCMSVKGLADDRRDEVWAHRRAEWWARRRLGKSSEDVWDARKWVSGGLSRRVG